VKNLSVVIIVPILLAAYMSSLSGAATASDSQILTEVHLIGTNRLSTDDVVRGLGLKLGEATTRQDLRSACDHFKRINIFHSLNCHYRVKGHSAYLTIFVDDKQDGLPIVFDNFVWTTKGELVAQLKREIPLFMDRLPESSGLTNDIIHVLEQVTSEHGIKAQVKYDDHFWTERGMNVFYIDGISTPVTLLQIEGINSPSSEVLEEWSKFYTKENFSAARLTWVIRWILRDLYFARGYLHPTVREPVIESLGEKEGTYPVRVVLPVLSGAQYKFDSVQFEGLAKEHSEFLHSKWKLKMGDPYDEGYVSSFTFDEILSAPWARHSKTEADVALPCARINEASKTVSLTITVEVPKKTYPAVEQGHEECGGIMSTLTFPIVH
jgi:outer membrane protein assembly factor BamA